MTRKYRATQAIHIGGWECGTEIELQMIVDFTVHPGCAQTLQSPAEPATVEVSSVRFMDGADEIKLPWSIEDRFTSRDEFKDWLIGEAADSEEYARDQAADACREDMRMGDL